MAVRTLCCVVAGVALWLASTAGVAGDAQPPNILLIVSDDQGYHDLGCCGHARLQTPHLDALAADGVRLTNFYVAWPACTPSRAALLTGRYPQRNGLYDMIRNDLVDYGYRYDEVTYALSPEMTLGLDVREVVLAQVLRRAGYACGMVGKWDLGQARRFLPPQRGFDFFYGFGNNGIDYWTHERYGIPSMFRGNQRVKEEGYATELFCREALRFLDENHQRPWFLYLAFNAPHGASSFETRGAQAPDEWLRRYPDLDPQSSLARYLACITCMDDCIGRILRRIDQLQQRDRTLVVFFSDNGGTGPSNNGPLRGRKGQLFEGGVRAPFVARFPGHIPPGRTSDAFVTALDLFPTLSAYAGAALPEGVVLDGFDVRDVLAGTGPSPRNEMFWQRRHDRAARLGHYKWVETRAGGGLFDLSQDVGEQHDLSAQRPELLAEIRARFAAWQRQMEQSEPRGPFRDY